jgi:hypothetical protein
MHLHRLRNTICQGASFRQHKRTPRQRLHKLNFRHFYKALVLEFINLGHHGEIETQKHISFNDGSACEACFLEDAFELAEAHEGLFAGF